MKRKLNICIIFLILLLAMTACSKKSYLSSNNTTESESTENSYSGSNSSKGNSTKSNSTKSSSGKCYVQISGAVNNPGVYELEGDARIFQVILMAGGLREDADDSSLNQAGKVSDGQKLVIMTKEEALAAAASNSSDGKVDINNADEATLMTLPGIGESKAKAIIKYRESNGPFGSTEDIKNISGIKDGVYVKIEDLIKV
ncbi:MAG: helix-hairpin-helix domain-containing protein [Lachnospiraceae bacterium]|nr:helix-hairpin-helix domain-containing protein [Lachnospiraceae bacterium]